MEGAAGREGGTAPEVAAAFLASRLVVFLAGLYAVLEVNLPGRRGPLFADPQHTLAALAAPFARWDAGWYLAIAAHPYSNVQEAAFFPVYPLAVRGLAAVLASYTVSGIIVSLAAFAGALALFARLARIELEQEPARNALMLLAFAPTGVFFSAIYTESLFLALSVGAFLCARTERWAGAGLCAGLAAATRNTGILLVVPLLFAYLYEPRAPREHRGGVRRLLPRRRIGPQILWLLLAPAGLAAVMAFMNSRYGDPLEFAHASQVYWQRGFHLLGGVLHAPHAIGRSLQAIADARPGQLYPAGAGTLRFAAANLLDVVAFTVGVAMLALAAWRLRASYAIYMALAMVAMASAPVGRAPLISSPRYLVVLFPAPLALASVIGRRTYLAFAAVGASAVLLGAFTVAFSTNRWLA